MKKVDYKLDTLRVLSMFLVIVIHVANYYCRAFSQISSLSYFGAVIFNAIARVSVPIFFMISGALLLSKEYDEKKNFQRIKKMIITLTIFTIVYLLWDKFYMHKEFTNYIGLLTSPERSMLWFMYAIIAIYIALPFIKCMTDNMNEKLDKSFIVLWMLFNGVVYLLNLFVDLDVKYLVPILSGTYYLGYFIAGYLIYKYKDVIASKKNNILWIIVLVLSLTATIGFTYVRSLDFNRYYDNFLAYRSIFVILSSLSIFLLIYFNLPNKKIKLVSFVSPYSFGVYLVHGIILNFLMEDILSYIKINSFIGIPICVIILSIFSVIVVALLKKVPVLKKYI
ncbi:MAG: acyltransferase family protein [Bacilli bacterium]|nr:acyltransferase family protein [Bacilli bacterium]